MRDRRESKRSTGVGRKTLWLLAILALAGPWDAPVSAQDSAYTFAGTELHQLDLATAELTLVGDVETSSAMVAVAVAPSGALYAADGDELFRIDPEIPAAALIGPLGIVPAFSPWSMTFDAAGRLWMTAGGILYEVDPQTGSAYPVGFGLDAGLLALAEAGGELFGIIHGAPPPPGLGPPRPPRVVKLDRDTGGVQMLAPLDGIDSFTGIQDLVFDRSGQAWILAIRIIPGLPSIDVHEIYRSFDLETGVVEFVSADSVFGISLQLRAMALVPDQRIVEIPTLGWGGLALFCATLIGCGLRFLRSRPRR